MSLCRGQGEEVLLVDEELLEGAGVAEGEIDARGLEPGEGLALNRGGCAPQAVAQQITLAQKQADLFFEGVLGLGLEPLGEIVVGKLHHDLQGVRQGVQIQGIEPARQVRLGDGLQEMAAELFLEHTGMTTKKD